MAFYLYAVAQTLLCLLGMPATASGFVTAALPMHAPNCHQLHLLLVRYIQQQQLGVPTTQCKCKSLAALLQNHLYPGPPSRS